MPVPDTVRPPFVSVVVPALDAGSQIADCLASLVAARYPSDRREIVIVDVGSSDSTADIVRRHPVRLLVDSRRNISHARNTGIESTQGEILAFTDTDCVVSAGWLEKLVEPFAASDVGVVAGAIVPFPPRTLAERYAARRRSHSQSRPLDHPRHAFAMTPNVAIRREAFRRIGLFDERFPGGGWEDADLCWRLRRRTPLRLAYAPAAVVFHRYRTTIAEFAVQHYRYGYGLGLILRKYGGELQGEWATALRTARDIGGACWSLIASAAECGLRRGDPADLGFRYLDLVRQVAQRSGYVRAALSRGPELHHG
jgi:GT2 family glycosyltransferase